jgi:hypothetical protein
VSARGSCPCGDVRFTVAGPLRDVIVCHCRACRGANGGRPWAASAARRGDLELEAPASLVWEKASVSRNGASRGFCRGCGAYVLWDAPGRATISLGAALVDDGGDLPVAAHIWVPADEQAALRAGHVPSYAEGMPAGVCVSWRDETGASS